MGCLPTSCEDYGYWGSCEGAAVIFCQDGELRSLDCGDRGQACGWVDEVQGNACDGERVDLGTSLEHCAAAVRFAVWSIEQRSASLAFVHSEDAMKDLKMPMAILAMAAKKPSVILSE